MAEILIVEDDPNALAALGDLLENDGYAVASATTLEDAKNQLANRDVELVLADVNLPDGKGTELLQAEERPFDLVLITGDATLDTAIEALRKGALDYLTKPLDIGRLQALLANLRRTTALKQEVSDLRGELRRAGRFGPMVGASDPMKKVYELIERVAPTDASVFVTGESGTGKELVAGTVHAMSQRRDGPFLPLNCGAVSENLIESELFGHEKGSFTGAERRHIGHFERASGGTLFLDEITEMPLGLQVKLLRVLETGVFLRVGGTEPIEVDVRVVAASNRDPREAVSQQKLREDLLYRLRVFPIQMPALRDRGFSDIELLTRHFVNEFNDKAEKEVRISDDAIEVLASYPWPGNVRELRNVLQRAYILADERIEPDHIPAEVRHMVDVPIDGDFIRIPLGTTLEEVERQVILATLEENDGRRADTAEILGISPKTLYNRLKAWEQQAEQEAGASEN